MTKKVGRPPIWTSPKVLKKLIDNYFENEQKITLSGLAGALDISRSTLYEYKKKDEFSDIIKKAWNTVETVYEERLLYGNRPAGMIFVLKNMGWSDKVKTDLTSKRKGISAPILGGISKNVLPNNNQKV